MSLLLSLYHRLPYPARVLAASAHGWRLGRLRYGATTPRLIEEARARETWGPDRWRRWTKRRLAALLERAATRVPYYRRHWERRPAGAWRDLAAWPVLTKQEVREHGRELVADDRDTRRMIACATSGSTGTPLCLWWPRATARSWYALYELRMRLWNGVSRRDRWAILGGQPIVRAGRERPPWWVFNAGLNQLYLSSYHVSDRSAPAMIGALRAHRVRFLLGYPSAMAALARAALDAGVDAPRLAVVLSNAEPLLPAQRAVLERVFSCPVRDSYGMAEIVAGGSECEQGTHHLWPEVGVVEVMRDGRDEPATAGEAGRLVCTGLLNPDMPLVRYEVGDRGAIVRDGAPCACGRTLPRLARLDGRNDAVIVTPDGRKVGRLDPVFKADLPIREAQVVQEDQKTLRVRIVPAAAFGARAASDLKARLCERLGEMDYRFELVDAIPRGPNGKFPAVVSRLDSQDAHPSA